MNLYYRGNHIILAIDISGSMNDTDSGENQPGTSRIVSVYSALKTFFNERLKKPFDVISVILFNSEAKISTERAHLNKDFVTRFMNSKVTPHGGTNFSKAFQAVDCILSRNEQKSLSLRSPPRMLFLSDGGSETDSLESFKPVIARHKDLEITWVLYGLDKNGKKQLEELAAIRGKMANAHVGENLEDILHDFSANIL